MPTRRSQKYIDHTEDVRTISRNVDEFLEVERSDASLFYFIDLRTEFPMLKYGLPTNHFETVQLGVVDPPLEGLP